MPRRKQLRHSHLCWWHPDSFLGVCKYSHQFIENYADLAKPLTELLKKDDVAPTYTAASEIDTMLWKGLINQGLNCQELLPLP